ncbi:hypothetical protein BF95_04260 [Sphingobium sp. Ant17]|nr:hypothetical protein BF95_04260 [Sphingobium sp. Ant17]
MAGFGRGRLPGTTRHAHSGGLIHAAQYRPAYCQYDEGAGTGDPARLAARTTAGTRSGYAGRRPVAHDEPAMEIGVALRSAVAGRTDRAGPRIGQRCARVDRRTAGNRAGRGAGV